MDDCVEVVHEQTMVRADNVHPSTSSNGSTSNNNNDPPTENISMASSAASETLREVLVPPQHEPMAPHSPYAHHRVAVSANWQLFAVQLHRSPDFGFGIGISGGRDNPHFVSPVHSNNGWPPGAGGAELVAGDPSIIVTDVLPQGPAVGQIKVNDRILQANGVSLENADYNTAVRVMKNTDRLNMIVKRRVPIPCLEFEQRTLKFTLSKSRKKDDFGIVLGCKFYIKEINNPKLAEKEPGLRESDNVLRINGQSLEGLTLDEATRLLNRSRDKLSLVVQRDVRRGAPGSRWPSQTTVYERLGSVPATPRMSPIPTNYAPMSDVGHISRRDCPELVKRHSEPVGADYFSQSQPSYFAAQASPAFRSTPRHASQTPSTACSSPRLNSFPLHQQQFQVQNQVPTERKLETVSFRKQGASLGIRVIGGNQVGIFISAVQDDSPAAKNGLRTLFPHQKRTTRGELFFQTGDIFHVTDTLHNGAVGFWQVQKVYSSSDHEMKPEECQGIIPNLRTADSLAKQSRMESSTVGKSLFRKKLQPKKTKSLSTSAEEETADLMLPAYERVVLKKPAFKRPVIFFGPLADIARQLLVANFSPYFGTVPDEGPTKIATVNRVIEQDKHCVLNCSPSSVERLQAVQYAPIVILIDVDSRNRIRELRSKAGATTVSARRLLEQTSKVKKHHAHLLTATLDALKEDGWFDALRMLIAHLQERRVWIPETAHFRAEDITLYPLTIAHSDDDNSRSDYAPYEGQGSPKMTTSLNSSTTTTPTSAKSSGNFVILDKNLERSPRNGHSEGIYDVEQLLAEHSITSAQYSSSNASTNPMREYEYVGKDVNAANNNGHTRAPGEPVKANGIQNQVLKVCTPESNGNGSNGGYQSNDGIGFIDDAAINHSPTKANGTAEPRVIENVYAVIDWNGGTVTCPESGVQLILPPMAVPVGKQQKLFVKVCEETANSVERGENVLSPVVMCGPQGMKFARPIELRLPHRGKRDPSHPPNVFDGFNQFVLKTGSANSWKNIELLEPPIQSAQSNYISVFVDHF